jgi:hypothetical protein
MKPISLKKMEVVEIEVLQQALMNMLTYKNAYYSIVDTDSNEYYDTILLIDVLQKLYYNFRGKIEKTSKTTANLNLSCSEAVVILMCCNFDKSIRNDFEKFVTQKIGSLLHQQLISI